MKNKKILPFLIPILLIIVVYLIGSLYYSNKFLPNTYFNTTNVGGKKVDDVKKEIQLKSENTNIDFIKIDSSTENIKLKDIDYKSNYKTDINKIKKQQNSFKWISSFFSDEKHKVEINTSYDNEKLNSLIDNLKCVSNEAIQDPVDAHIEKNEKGFSIVDAVDGNRIDVEKLKTITKENINEGIFKIDLNKNNCYLKANIESSDPSLKEMMSKLKKFNDLIITIDLTNSSETLNYSIFKDWINVENGEITVDEEQTKQYVKKLSSQYDTFGSERKFNATGIGEITVGGTQYDTYGFQTDIDKTITIIQESIKLGESITIKPEYKIPALTRTEFNDIGNTYIEVDLTRQHMWYYIEGQLYLETDITSGLPTAERETPTGAFRVWSKEKGRYLTGPGYRSWVDYWMPFTWTGCGIHDATWRSTFGGTYYQSSGSHGCLNTPFDNAKAIYDKVTIDTPVIVYKS